MDFGLDGKTAFVVRPDDGIGAACVRLLGAEGARVVGALDDDVDIVVAHGSAPGATSVEEVTVEGLHASWDVVVDTMDLYRRALPAMAGRGWGRFVWVGSAASRSLDADDDELDAVTTLAVRAANKVIAAEVGPSNVTANAVIHGGAATDDDVASAVAFLCSGGAGYLTGVTITVDGGVGAAVH